MKAIHINSTLPSVPYLGRVKSPDGYQVEDFELLTTVLSAAAWRRFNGPIKLYTDRLGEAYYRRLGMAELWDGGIDTAALESLDPSISHDVFWTAGRVVALRAEAAPFCSLDTDLVVWGPLGRLITSESMALHPEPLHHLVYKSRCELSTPPGYVWEEWDWEATPCNASLTYFADGRLTELFHEKAMAFIVGNPMRREPVSRLPVHDVFVAQRLLPMCALRLGVRPAYFLHWPRPERNSETMAGGGRNRLFTHVWAHKDSLKRDPRQREAFCLRCVARILADYPELGGMLRHMPDVRRYLPRGNLRDWPRRRPGGVPWEEATVKAIHVVSTRPTANYYVSRSEGSPYRQEDFEVLTTILSALEWRRHNGVVRLYTDPAGREFYDRLGLLGLWDGGVDAEHLELASATINCRVFWSFGKAVALRREEAPCCLMDIDLIVWDSIRELVTAEVMSLHEEPLAFAAYVGRDRLVAPPGFDWSGLDWSVTPCSAALLVFNEDAFKNEYADRALSFMEGNPIPSEPGGALPAHPVFVEQRLLPMCAKASGVRVGSFLPDYRGTELRSGRKNAVFTHLWNAKTLFHNSPNKSKDLCAKYARRVRRDYPEVAEALAESELLRDHFRTADDLPYA